MKPPGRALFSWVQRLSLTRKVVGLTLLLGTGVWLGFDYQMTRDLEGVFLETVKEDLEGQALRDRYAFNQRLEHHNRAARLIASQMRFTEYVAKVDWSERHGPPLIHREPPPWMPERSILEAFYDIRFAILLNARGNAREVFSPLPAPPPEPLLSASALLEKLAPDQSHLIEIGQTPYTVAVEPFDMGGHTGTLLFASPIDNKFLRRVAHGAGPDTYLALIGDQPRRVIASNAPDFVSPGTEMSQLQSEFLVTTKSFSDYGATDLDAQLSSLLTRSAIEQQMNSVLSKAQHKRIWLTAALLLPFILLTYAVARQMRELAAKVDEMAVLTLGRNAFSPLRGDELSGLMARFQTFSTALAAARHALKNEVRTRLRFKRTAIKNKERARHSRHLQAVTNAMQVGVIVKESTGTTPANATMRDFIRECGDIDAFLVGTETESTVLHLEDADGRERMFHVRRPANGEEQTLLVRDITREVQIDRERRLFAFMPAESPNPILRVDSSGRLEYANRASEPLLAKWNLGVNGELPGSLQDELQRAMRNSGSGTFEIGVTERCYQFFVARIEDSDFVYLYGNDVTEHKWAEASINSLNDQLAKHVVELLRTNRDLEAFSYSVSHDLKGPLRTIDGFSHILLEEHAAELSESAKSDLQRIRTAVAHMNGLMEGLLKLSRVSRAEPQIEEIDLSAIARETGVLLQQMKPDQSVEFVVEEGLTAAADGNLLQVVMENLLGNAWKFTSGRALARIHFGVKEVAGETAFYVRDNGAGFRMAHADRLFIAFERLHAEREFSGHGIGLATVSRIIERHGGRIWAEAEPDRGATFYFTFPSRDNCGRSASG
ncbi:sensor histidine kinase [Thiohalomonas denitrificans]|uniref:histidine kinase n=1 Tax=Thiohalomonas denitrificans TaxID=415747 RepID=A0A1G5QKA7_9GAMM|nr:ATP-binding protein [Thiohalomonas denitrificans]SCZ62036.1 His Kinase A (phospho-acceptor) domain-containing protein [Thiohalomonas denitrificans]